MALTNTHESVIKGPAPFEPVSRTYQYRKVMKPMLERKRRARINRLDELKELVVTALQSEGENVSKLEKADILELTVRHLHKLRRQQRLSANRVVDADRFRSGFECAIKEVSRCLASTPFVDVRLGTNLMEHLAHHLNDLDKVQPLSIQVGQTMHSPPTSTSVCSESHYAMPLTPASSRSGHSSSTPSPRPMDYTNLNNITSFNHYHQGLLKVAPQPLKESVWRPW